MVQDFEITTEDISHLDIALISDFSALKLQLLRIWGETGLEEQSHHRSKQRVCKTIPGTLQEPE